MDEAGWINSLILCEWHSVRPRLFGGGLLRRQWTWQWHLREKRPAIWTYAALVYLLIPFTKQIGEWGVLFQTKCVRVANWRFPLRCLFKLVESFPELTRTLSYVNIDGEEGPRVGYAYRMTITLTHIFLKGCSRFDESISMPKHVCSDSHNLGNHRNIGYRYWSDQNTFHPKSWRARWCLHS